MWIEIVIVTTFSFLPAWVLNAFPSFISLFSPEFEQKCEYEIHQKAFCRPPPPPIKMWVEEVDFNISLSQILFIHSIPTWPYLALKANGWN